MLSPLRSDWLGRLEGGVGVPAELRVDAEWLRNEIADSIARYDAMRRMSATTDADRAALLAAFRSWDERNQRLLEQAFTPVAWHESSPKSDYTTLKDLEFVLLEELPLEQAPGLGRLADEKKRRLESISSSLDIYQKVDNSNRQVIASRSEAVPPDDSEAGKAMIFLVHGRDRGAREEVHRFLKNVTEVEVIVLAERPNRGQTIIEKLEGHLPSQTFVVVLATGDDEGRLKGDGELSLRVRQNVIFELGLAVGRVGRSKVAILYEDSVELPSDYYGMGYIDFDSGGGWKLPLMGELKAAGFTVDANRALD